ncbi:MAG: VOC family protein [Ignavibacteria bacterium]|nr:VOC family protein [Ignavibacteria bacterium]
MNRIPDHTHISNVTLKVKDLKRSLTFYRDLLGFHIIKANDTEAYLSSDNEKPFLVKLKEFRNLEHPALNTTGLFHIAFRLPSRKDLAGILKHLFESGSEFTGFSDHGVSEAVYLQDPDGNGIELYSDKPESIWERNNGKIKMITSPLDIKDLLSVISPYRRIHPETTIGHIHLKVSDLEKAKKFYHELMGFNITNDAYPGAVFFAAGTYHHHIGTNIWYSKNSQHLNNDYLGLENFTIKTFSNEYLSKLEKSLYKEGIKFSKAENNLIRLSDYDGIGINFTV